VGRIETRYRERWRALYGAACVVDGRDRDALAWCYEQLAGDEEELARRIDAYFDDRSDRLRRAKHPAAYLRDARTLNRYARKPAGRSQVSQAMTSPPAIAAAAWERASPENRRTLIESYLAERVATPLHKAAREVLQKTPLANPHFRDWLAQTQQGETRC
jgi:hypothetical protein